MYESLKKDAGQAWSLVDTFKGINNLLYHSTIVHHIQIIEVLYLSGGHMRLNAKLLLNRAKNALSIFLANTSNFKTLKVMPNIFLFFLFVESKQEHFWN